eukprot:4149983-Prymnesium_polylepis.1
MEARLNLRAYDIYTWDNGQEHARTVKTRIAASSPPPRRAARGGGARRRRVRQLARRRLRDRRRLRRAHQPGPAA